MIVAVIDGKDEVYIDRYIDIECNYRAFFFFNIVFFNRFYRKEITSNLQNSFVKIKLEIFSLIDKMSDIFLVTIGI